MKRTPSLLTTGLLQAALVIGLGLCQGLAATVTFTNTPAAVSNTYNGFITLQVGGLTNGETVVVQQFYDLNTNGVIDAGDWLAQQFQLTDGQASTIGGIVNSNVPGDITPTNGAITAQMSFLSTAYGVPMAGRYLYKLSSPSGRFTPVTNLFNVTNLPYSQSVTGNVVCSSTNVPNAVVMAFLGQPFNSSPVAGVVANSAGGYSLPVPPGTYNLVALRTNYVINGAIVPAVVVGTGATVNTNLSLSPATCSISGRMADANSGVGLPGIWILPKSTNSLITAGFTDTNGNFTVQVTASQWKMSYDDNQLPALGYVRLQNSLKVDSTTGSVANVAMTLSKATALFYGSVKDVMGNPMVGIDMYAHDSNDQYEIDNYTDVNGNYSAGVLGGLSNDPWQISVSTDGGSTPANYVFSQPAFEQNGGGTNLAVGQAVRVDFVGLLATNQISGYLKDGSGNPISNVNVWAQATIAGTSFGGNIDTDASGHYVLNVGNGSWTVGVCCGGGGDCLGSQYLCPGYQTITIANNNTNVNFTALLPTSQINGYVKDTSDNAITNVGVYAYMPSGGNNTPPTTTDSSGHYSFNVANGSWNVGVDCCGNNSLNPLGYLCVAEQSTNVFNSTNVVNFSIPRAPYQITGHLRDGANNPIPNVNVWAGDNNSDNACATTAADGSYTLNVISGDWNVSLDCTGLGSFSPPYLCPNAQEVIVSGASVVLDFSTVQAPYTISGSVKSTSSQPITNLDVQASATIGTNNWGLDVQTDSNGNYSFQVANGQWDVSLACWELNGYVCPGDVNLVIAGASVVTNFTLQACSALQILTTSPLPAGQVGSYYDIFLQASSCYPDFSWAITAGSLPPGLTGNPFTGELYGSPLTNGTWVFTVQVTDGNSAMTNTVCSLTIASPPPDVAEYYMMKMEILRQIDSANLVPDTNYGPFMAKSGIVQSGLNNVPIAGVYLPSGGGQLFPPGSSGIELVIRESYPSQAAFDAVYTNGNYTFAMDTAHNGSQFPVLAMPVAVYPTNPPPRLSNFTAAQAINPTSLFTLQWSNPSDATTNDTIWVWITDANGNIVFSTPYPPTNYSACLKGTATSAAVPANTLKLGSAYTGCIGFFRVNGVNTTAFPGATGLTLVGVITDFPMVAPSASLPVLSQPTRISSSQFGFLLSGTSGTNYTVLTSTNAALHLSNWATVLITNLPGSSAFIQDNQATNKQRYYRVKVGP